MEVPPVLQLRRPLHDCVASLCSGCGVRRVAVAQPVVDLHFRLCFAVAIPLLQYTGEFFRLATQSGDVIVGEFCPTAASLGL